MTTEGPATKVPTDQPELHLEAARPTPPCAPALQNPRSQLIGFGMDSPANPSSWPSWRCDYLTFDRDLIEDLNPITATEILPVLRIINELLAARNQVVDNTALEIFTIHTHDKPTTVEESIIPEGNLICRIGAGAASSG